MRRQLISSFPKNNGSISTSVSQRFRRNNGGLQSNFYARVQPGGNGANHAGSEKRCRRSGYGCILHEHGEKPRLESARSDQGRYRRARLYAKKSTEEIRSGKWSRRRKRRLIPELSGSVRPGADTHRRNPVLEIFDRRRFYAYLYHAAIQRHLHTFAFDISRPRGSEACTDMEAI